MLFSSRQKKITTSILLIILVAFLVGLFNSIIILWKSGYIEEGQSISSYNSVELDVLSSLESSYKSILPTADTEVQKIYLYISEKNQKHLLSDLPGSRKDWVEGLKRESGQFKKISVKHRGDNPNNWLHDKKSWRLKRKKSDLKDGMRVFNYSLPRDSALINTYMGYYIADKMNIPVPKFNFVEIYINDEYQGLYLETQHIDENYLRMSKIMPVNIYKGTPSRTDKPLNLDSDLFNNPFLWKKSAVFNARDSSNFSDLERLLVLIRASVNNAEKMHELEEVADIKKWATFSAYETIMQSWHNYEKNNMYLISDPWIGEVYPIAYDTIFNDTKAFIEIDTPINMDNAAHALTEVYSNNPKFLYEKYKILDRLIKNNFYDDIEKEASRIYNFIRKSWENDPSHVQFALSNEFNRSLIFNKGMDEEVSNFLKRINFIEEKIKENLNDNKTPSWMQINNEFEFVINSYRPISKIKICLESELSYVKINLIEKGLNKFSGQKDNNGCYDFNIIMNANRIKPQGDSSRVTNFSASNGFDIKPTIFSFIIDKDIEIKEVYAMFMSSQNYVRASNDLNLNKHTRLNKNYPFSNDSIQKPIIWQGDIYIDEVIVLDSPVTILPGTSIYLGPKASIVFKNQVQSIGKKNSKINFLRSHENPWGVVALVGQETKGSIFEHTNLSGGSGGSYSGYEFTGMFSIYLSKEIKLSHMNISNNSKYDDLIHILYSTGVKLSNSNIFDARSDAIDIDISKAEINDSSFYNSGNDAIDAMTSTVIVSNTYIDNAGDKAISAGEGSEVFVSNLIFDNNEIAIQSKDGANVTVQNSKFLNNKIQLDAYQKNWRYGNGGKINVQGSYFEGNNNQIKAKNKSKIKVIDSFFSEPFLHLNTKKVELIGNNVLN